LALTAFLALPAVTSAQSHQEHHPQSSTDQRQEQMMMGQGQGMMGSGMMGMMGMMSGPSPSMILMQKDVLHLEPSQVEQLETLQHQLAELRQSHMEEIAPLRAEMRAAVHSDQPDLSHYESALENMAEHHVKMHVEMARVSQLSMEVLNAEQRSSVRYGMALMGHMMNRGMMQGGGMMMGASGCPMMNQMGQMRHGQGGTDNQK